MSKDELNNKYFEWMYQLVYDDRLRFKRLSYRKLLSLLHTTEFIYSVEMDSNRWTDGINLRYRFGSESSISDRIIVQYLGDEPCSVLEMMMALALRCEENIMKDVDMGDRTAHWFWSMIDNMGLGMMSDPKFDKTYVQLVTDSFLNRDYGYHGEGSLFTVLNPRKDMRNVEMWYQMCWYLDELSCGGR